MLDQETAWVTCGRVYHPEKTPSQDRADGEGAVSDSNWPSGPVSAQKPGYLSSDPNPISNWRYDLGQVPQLLCPRSLN